MDPVQRGGAWTWGPGFVLSPLLKRLDYSVCLFKHELLTLAVSLYSCVIITVFSPNYINNIREGSDQAIKRSSDQAAISEISLYTRLALYKQLIFKITTIIQADSSF